MTELERQSRVTDHEPHCHSGSEWQVGHPIDHNRPEHGFEVSALVRSPEKITRANYKLTLIEAMPDPEKTFRAQWRMPISSSPPWAHPSL